MPPYICIIHDNSLKIKYDHRFCSILHHKAKFQIPLDTGCTHHPYFSEKLTLIAHTIVFFSDVFGQPVFFSKLQFN